MEKIHSQLAIQAAGQIQPVQEIRCWEGGNKAWHDLGKVKMIETRTREDIINLLKRHDLGKLRRKKMLDYERAKKVCFEGLFIDSRIFDKQIGWICGYLKV